MKSQRDAPRERLFYIDFLAFFTGQVTRKDLVTRFGISEPAATKDLSLYTESAPEMLRYDLRQKCYVFVGKKPYFEHQVDQSLYSLAGVQAPALNVENSKRLPSWAMFSIKRKMPLDLVARITRCIYQHQKMVVEYVSMSSGAQERTLSPLAIVHDGSRWHIRCFDHAKEDYRDFNLARFNSVKEGDTSDVRLENDNEWTTEIEVKLVPHPKADYPQTICTDYDMVDQMKTVHLRPCLVGYFLRQWHIDYSDDASGNPSAQHLYLLNKAELMGKGVPDWTFKL